MAFILEYGWNKNKHLNENESITNSDEDYILLGDFLKLLITNSISNVDYDLIESDVNHYAGLYLSIAENYGVVERHSITAKMLDEPFNRLTALKLCALCDINIRHHEQQQVIKEKKSLFNDLSDVDRELIEHAITTKIIHEIPNEEFLINHYLTRNEASEILTNYLDRVF